MAGVLIPISSTTLGSSAASVTFSSIPQTYTDLVLRFTARCDSGQTDFNLTINSDSSTAYSFTALYWGGTSIFNARSSNATSGALQLVADWSTATANTFGSAEIYLSNYTAAMSKAISQFSVTENNNTTAYGDVSALLYRSNTAISTLQLTPPGANIVAGSTFHLYGVK